MHRALLTIARSAILSAAVLAMLAAPASAQGLKLSFHDGLVSVEATSVPVRTILTEWGKVGGTKIVGAERVSGAPLTVKLVNVTEAKALETILRSVAGYMAAPRTGATTGPSRYDRILVMATTSTPATASAARPQPQQPGQAFAGTQRFVPPRPQRPEQQEQEEPEEPDENPPNPPVFTFPQPGQQQNGGFNQPGTNFPGQAITVNPSSGAPQGIVVNPVPGQTTAPIGVSQPGMMIPVPQPNTTPQPGQMIRPPGQQRQQQ